MQTTNTRSTSTSLLLPFFTTLLLLFSWGFYPTISLWEWIDGQLFHFLNAQLIDRPLLQQLTVFMNSRYGDWIFEASVISFYLAYAFWAGEKSKKKELVFLLVTAILTQLLINKFFFFKLLHIYRESPSLVFSDYVDLSHYVYLNHRVGTIHSYPADHATTLLLCTFFAWKDFRKGAAIAISFLSFLFALPRLICGAHWFTDIVMGALPIALIGFWIAKECEKLYNARFKKP